MRKFLRALMSSSAEASSKRFICILLTGVLIISHFLIMYIKVEIANQDLVKDSQSNLFWLVLIFGGFITAEPIMKFFRLGAFMKPTEPEKKEGEV